MDYVCQVLAFETADKCTDWLATFEIPLVTKQEPVTADVDAGADGDAAAAAVAVSTPQSVVKTYVDCKTSMNVLANF